MVGWLAWGGRDSLLRRSGDGRVEGKKSLVTSYCDGREKRLASFGFASEGVFLQKKKKSVSSPAGKQIKFSFSLSRERKIRLFNHDRMDV